MNRRLARLNSGLVNLAAGLIGVALVLIALLVSRPDPRTILLSVGASVIASAIFAYVTSHYLFRDTYIKNVIDTWRLDGIYRTRADMTASSNSALRQASRQIDVIAFGLKGFRESQGAVLEARVRAGLRVRFLVPHPDSMFVAQREADENEVAGQIRKTILDLITWAGELRNAAKRTQDVDLRVYDGLPLDFYMRIDDSAYVGPYLRGLSSQQTISFEFSGGAGVEYWSNYFESLWRDPAFCRSVL